jgi:hypothetical protein
LPAALLIAYVGGLVLFATSKYGVALSPDSVGYIVQGRAIAESGPGFVIRYHDVGQPPLYSIILAALSRAVSCDAMVAARILNAFCASLLTIVIMLSLRRCSRATILFGGLMAASSIPLFNVYTVAWTEPLFILIVYTLLTLLPSTSPGTKSVLIAAALTGAACLTRYAGITLIPAIFAYLLLRPAGSPQKRLYGALLYVPAAAFPLVVNLVRNYWISGTFMGRRVPSPRSLIDNLELTVRSILGWSPPLEGVFESPGLLSLGIVAASAFGFYFFGKVLLRGGADRIQIDFLMLTFLATYLLFILITSTTTKYDRIGDRLLSPIVPAICILGARFFDVTYRYLANGKRSSPARIPYFVVFILVFVVAPGKQVIEGAISQRENGAGGFNHRIWRESELVKYLNGRTQMKTEKIYSNAPFALYITTGLMAKFSPHANPPGHPGSNQNIFENDPDLDGALLAWFYQMSRPGFLSIEDLGKLSTITTVADFPDGRLVRIESGGGE